MQPLASHGLTLIAVLLALVLSAASPILQRYSFNIGSDYGNSQSFPFSVKEAGCILAQIKSWEPAETNTAAAEELALTLADADNPGYYARNDGGFSSLLPLWTSYAVSASEVTEVKVWEVSVSNYTKSGGTAKGMIILEMPPTQIPCELKAAIPRSKKGQIDLSWRYTGKRFNGSFLVERLIDGTSQWEVVSACTKRTTSTDYSCSDTGLTRGDRYYYRACAVTSTSSECGRTNLTPPVSVRAP